MTLLKKPVIKSIPFPELIGATSHLKSMGKLKVSSNHLVYLDIDDDYVHKLFPLLKDKAIQKPNYFSNDSAGAHITVIYPEENTKIKKEDLGKSHHFSIKKLVSAEIGLKTYYVLLVESASLLKLRKKYGLPDALCFKNYAIDLHITIGNSL